jgi:colicin import membrane protein
VQLAIEAVVVDARDLASTPTPRTVKPVARAEPPPRVEPRPAPEPEPEPVQSVEKTPEPVQEQPDRREEQRKAEEARQQQALREEQQAKERAAAEKRKAEEAKKAQEAEARKQAEADARKKQEQEKAARDSKLQAQREAELQRQLAAEEAEVEAAAAVARSGVIDEYRLLLVQTIERNWNRPPSARAGLECTLFVTQATGGTVVDVKLGPCNGDDAVRQSIVNAVYRSSPLPAPSDPRAFQRKLEIVFKPTE